MKRVAGRGNWDTEVEPEATEMAKQLAMRIKAEDPTRGPWEVPKTENGKVWCDASSMAIEVCVEIGGGGDC